MIKTLFALSLLAIACGQSAASPTSGGKPTCAAIDRACDPYEDAPGLGKECHDMAESSSADEAVCVRRKDECLAACPPKK